MHHGGREDILPHFLTSRTNIIYADPEFGPASQRMMAAIVAAMINKQQVARIPRSLVDEMEHSSGLGGLSKRGGKLHW